MASILGGAIRSTVRWMNPSRRDLRLDRVHKVEGNRASPADSFRRNKRLLSRFTPDRNRGRPRARRDPRAEAAAAPHVRAHATAGGGRMAGARYAPGLDRG